MRSRRFPSSLATLGLLGAAACAATRPAPSAPSEDTRCVVAVEPTMRMVTFASPAGLAEGVTSLFFATLPSVASGDLVRLQPAAGQSGPDVVVVEKAASACREVLEAAEGHHANH